MTALLTVVFFDLMDTVLADPYREAVSAATGLPLDELRGLTDPESWPAFEIGDIDEAEFVRRFYADPSAGHRFDRDAFHEARQAGYRFLPGMRELLGALEGRVERVVASNYPVWIEQLAERFAFDGLFESVWSSHHLGVRKPDPAFFERLVGKVGAQPGACLFVDDRRVNCEAARAAGLRAHRFAGAADLRRRLRREGVLQR